jgi:RNA polymerase sigma-70 factor (ECF subfamily)
LVRVSFPALARNMWAAGVSMREGDAIRPVRGPEAGGAAVLDADAPLVGRARAGDRDSFSELVKRHHRRVFNLASRILGDREAAADATQETFLSAYQHLGEFEERARFSTWITRIAVNRCRNVLRSAAVSRRDVLDDPIADPRPGPEAQAGAREIAGHLARALATIDADHREVVVLREIEGLSYGAIAEILGVEEGTVKSRLHRARAALRERLRGVWP